MVNRINFQSLPREMKLMITTKMENSEVMKLSATCSDADRFVQLFKRQLHSRLYMGESVYLEATQNGIFIQKQVQTEKSMNTRLNAEDVDFQKIICSVAISQLKIVVKDDSMIPRLLDILKNWNPLCQMATITANIPSEHILQIDNCIRFTSNIMIDCWRRNGSEFFSNLRKVKNPEMHTLRLQPFAQFDNLLENVRDFGNFKMIGTGPELGTFLSDLKSSNNPGNLRGGSFTFLCKTFETLRIPFLLVAPGLPETSIIFKASPAEVLKSGARCVLKMPLDNGKCAFIQERNIWRPLAKRIDFEILKDDEMDILNFLIEILQIEEHFPGNSRKVLLVMSEEQRMAELQMAYSAVQEDLRMRNLLKSSYHSASH